MTVNGYIVMSWKSYGRFGMRDGIIARLVDRFLRRWYGWEWLREQCRLDRMACGIPLAEISPWWTLSWWCGLPLRAINKLCVDVDKDAREEGLLI